jgi:hypothetical protein
MVEQACVFDSKVHDVSIPVWRSWRLFQDRRDFRSGQTAGMIIDGVMTRNKIFFSPHPTTEHSEALRDHFIAATMRLMRPLSTCMVPRRNAISDGAWSSMTRSNSSSLSKRSSPTIMRRAFSDHAATISSGSTPDNETRREVKHMRKQFLGKSDCTRQQGQIWESLWRDGRTPWDLGRPTQVLIDELENFYKPRILHSRTKRYSLRTLVPGCGAGYDLISLARFHDDLIASGHIDEACVVGLDISTTSLDRAVEEIEKANEFLPFDQPTRIKLVKGDFLIVLSGRSFIVSVEIAAHYGKQFPCSRLI